MGLGGGRFLAITSVGDVGGGFVCLGRCLRAFNFFVSRLTSISMGCGVSPTSVRKGFGSMRRGVGAVRGVLGGHLHVGAGGFGGFM